MYICQNTIYILTYIYNIYMSIFIYLYTLYTIYIQCGAILVFTGLVSLYVP